MGHCLRIWETCRKLNIKLLCFKESAVYVLSLLLISNLFSQGTALTTEVEGVKFSQGTSVGLRR